MLTTTQLTQLRTDLQQLARIEYDEVLDELLDHYATLTEQQMTAGLSFADASKWAWYELGSGNGLAQVQDNWETATKQQIKTRHVAIAKSYFRWPTIVTTLLVAVLVGLLVPYLSGRQRIIMVFGLMLLPMFLMIRGYWQQYDRETNSRKLIWTYLYNSNFNTMNMMQIGLNLSQGFFDEQHVTRTFLQTYTGVAVFLCLLLLVYGISTVQLYREKFRVKVA
jgi:hypothetical protein